MDERTKGYSRSDLESGDCYRMLINITRIQKTTNIGALVVYLTDNNSTVREAAKERFDELERK